MAHEILNADEIQEAAYRVFDRWRAEHDPDGEMDILDAAAAFHSWIAENSITPYLDGALMGKARGTSRGKNGHERANEVN
jgi:hypothetical protein